MASVERGEGESREGEREREREGVLRPYFTFLQLCVELVSQDALQCATSTCVAVLSHLSHRSKERERERERGREREETVFFGALSLSFLFFPFFLVWFSGKST
jgi:hypothetical protein